MTTVDFYVEDADGEHLLSFHNGLFGPATTLLHAAWDLAQAGKMAPTQYNIAELKSSLTGAVLRELLTSVKLEPGDPYTNPSAEEVQDFLRHINDTGTYGIFGIEV